MLSRGIRERVFSDPELVSHFTQYSLCTLRVCENVSVVRGHPSYISTRRRRSFCISTRSSAASLAANRISRVARTEAQSALLDYLLSTRGFQYSEAEYISKNSPHFLEKVLSEVDDKQDLRRALSRYFRFNPVNEFEPFLECLGLSSHELAPLLPRNLMFLSDDIALLENYNALCTYGIPRHKIGKMYKEVKEIFGYHYSILPMKLKAYEELGFSKSTVIELVSCWPSLLISGVDNVGVLEKLKGLGFGTHCLLRFLSDKADYDWGQMAETMEFFGRLGYSEKQMGTLFKRFPALLLDEVGKQKHVLVGQLLKLGLTMSQIFAMLLKHPQILFTACIQNLLGAVRFLFEIGMETGIIATIVEKQVDVLGSHSLKGSKTVKRILKVEQDALCQIIKNDPLKLITLASRSDIIKNDHLKRITLASKSDTNMMEKGTIRKSNLFLEKTAFLLRLGYVENSDEMTKAFKKFRGRGDQLQERFDCLVQAGLDCDVVSSMVKQMPNIVNQSKEVLEKKLDYLKNRLGYPVESIAAFPSYLGYDLQRINLRFSMYVWLRERGTAKPKLSLSTLLACSDARFARYFVDIHPDGAAMWRSLQKASPSS